MADTGDRFFATYFEVGYYPAGSSDWTMRWQWAVMPAAPEHESVVIFTRVQKFPKNAAQWHGMRSPDAEWAKSDFMRRANQNDRKVHGPIVVEITLDELVKYVGGPKFQTPWKVLERGDSVAQRLGFKIT